MVRHSRFGDFQSAFMVLRRFAALFTKLSVIPSPRREENNKSKGYAHFLGVLFESSDRWQRRALRLAGCVPRKRGGGKRAPKTPSPPPQSNELLDVGFENNTDEVIKTSPAL
jgi:hypothetical protein